MNTDQAADTQDSGDGGGVCLCPTYARVPGRRELHDVGAPGCAYAASDPADGESSAV